MTASAESLVPVSGGSGYNVRTISQTINESGTDTTVQTQVMALGDATGTLIDFTAGALPVTSTELVGLLKAMLIRLDLLCHLIDSRYNPPDTLGL